MGDNNVKNLAYETGMYYSQNEKCQPGVPFYAFTQGELDRFVEKLSNLQGEAVPVAFTSETQLTALRESGDGLMGPKGKHWNIPLYTHPQPAELSAIPTMEDALAAGDGTLHGAVEHWQDRALAAERKLAELGEVSGNSGELGDMAPFLNDVVTAASLLRTGHQSKPLADRISNEAFRLIALAATGKQQVGSPTQQFQKWALENYRAQQVGEVPGSREQFEAWHIDFCSRSPELESLHGFGDDKKAWAAWQAALAALAASDDSLVLLEEVHSQSKQGSQQ